MASNEHREFVGRADELDRLAASFEAAVDQYATQTVLLIGEEGVGKSRMVDHWVSCLDSRQVRVLRAEARADDGPYRVFRRLLQGRFPRPEDPQAQVEVIRAQVEDVMQDRRVTEILHFLGTFLGLAVRGSPFLAAFDDAPGQQEQVACTVLCRFLELDAAQTPLLLILDDLHLADDRSLALFKQLVGRLGGSRVMLVGVGRPELLARDSELRQLEGDATIMQLGPLPDGEAEALLRTLFANAPVLPGSLLERAVELCRGNPLYLEMLVSVLLEDGTIEVEGAGADDERWVIDADRAAHAELPMSVAEAVRARIAVLAPAERDLLEKAAVFGGSFWRSALICLCRLESEVQDKARVWTADTLAQQVRERLELLCVRGYLRRLPESTIAGEVEYDFRRAVEREHVDQLIDAERRQRYHLLAAQWLETRRKERSEPQLEELASHYERGGAAQRAAYAFIHAGDKARSRFANGQAIAYYERGMALLDQGDVLPRIEALHNLGDIYGLVGRYGSAQESFAEMLQLAWLVDHRGKGGAAHRRLGRLHRTMGAIESAITHLRMAIRLFRLVDDGRGVAATLDDLGCLLADKGEYDTALERHRRALTLKRDIGDPRAIAVSLHNMGIAYDESGAFSDAQDCFREALELRRGIGDRLGVADTLDRLAAGHRARSDYTRARERWLEALAVAHEIGDRAQEARVLLRLGESLVQLGRLDEADQRIGEATALSENLGDQLLQIETHRTRAELELTRGDLDAARAEAELAYALVEEVQLEPQRGLALRSLGEIAAAHAMNAGESAQAADGETPLRERALELFDRAADVFCALGNDLELARTYALLSNVHDRLANLREAASYRQRADEIFARLAGEDSTVSAEPISAAEIDLPLEADLPGEIDTPLVNVPPHEEASNEEASHEDAAHEDASHEDGSPHEERPDDLELAPEQRETIRVPVSEVEAFRAGLSEASADELTIAAPEDRDTAVLRAQPSRPIDPAERAQSPEEGSPERVAVEAGSMDGGSLTEPSDAGEPTTRSDSGDAAAKDTADGSDPSRDDLDATDPGDTPTGR
jgi:tetratricopeptide (TPR) repeat protein